MAFKVKYDEVPNHIDMAPYAKFYRGAVKTVKGNTFVELGVRDGCSSRIIIEALGKRKADIYLIDAVSNPLIEELVEDPRVRYIVKTAEEVVHMFKYGQIDFLHIDLDPHSYEQTSEIFTLYEPKMSPKGIIVFHDCTPAWGVYKFVKENIEPHPEWVVEYATPHPDSGLTAPAMAVRIG